MSHITAPHSHNFAGQLGKYEALAIPIGLKIIHAARVRMNKKGLNMDTNIIHTPSFVALLLILATKMCFSIRQMVAWSPLLGGAPERRGTPPVSDKYSVVHVYARVWRLLQDPRTKCWCWPPWSCHTGTVFTPAQPQSKYASDLSLRVARQIVRTSDDCGHLVQPRDVRGMRGLVRVLSSHLHERVGKLRASVSRTLSIPPLCYSPPRWC